ncbi:hypothetical protein [Halegenticoccus soli]|nr:hypothetical protein [Halegenticoccus soli]
MSDEADVAWQLYLDRGVILPGYAGEIAGRRVEITAEANRAVPCDD